MVEELKRQAADRASELQRMQASRCCFHLRRCCSSRHVQAAVVGGEKALEKELAAALQVISKLEGDVNASRANTDAAKLAVASLEKQLETATARCADALYVASLFVHFAMRFMFDVRNLGSPRAKQSSKSLSMSTPTSCPRSTRRWRRRRRGRSSRPPGPTPAPSRWKFWSSGGWCRGLLEGS